MSRRYSDQPINLIARIPSPEQMSAVRPRQRSFGRLVMESGAACARGVAEAAAQLGRWCRSVGSSLRKHSSGGVSFWQAGDKVTGVTRSVAKSVSQSYHRWAIWIGTQDSTVPSTQSTRVDHASMAMQAVGPVERAADAVPFDDLTALRAEVAAHRQEVVRLSSQVQELKSLVGSQQQVLAYLGKELEMQQIPVTMAAAQASPSAKKARVVRTKSGAKEPLASRKGSREPSLNL